MSTRFIFYTTTDATAYLRKRPAYYVAKIDAYYAYYREEENSPWLSLNKQGRLMISLELENEIHDVKAAGIGVRLAFVQAKHRETVNQCLSRGLTLPVQQFNLGKITPDTAMALS